jgi:enoyl-[acyl-carrier protein] reductase II
MIIDTFFEKGREFLGCKYPIICGAMTWVSDPKLVSAIGNAGGFGLLAGGNTSVEIFEKQIVETSQLTDKPFGVNLITLAPVYQDQLELVCKLGCPVVVFAGGIPKKSDIKKVKRCGAKVICFAPTAPLAHKLIERGADSLMLEGSEAGGHIGPVALSVLIQQILFQVETVPLFVAGGIATGRMTAHLLMMGAAGVQMGTRFIMSKECIAHPKFKEVFRKAKAKDAMATPQFDSRLPVIPVRALKNEGTIEFAKLQIDLLSKLDDKRIDRMEAQYKVEEFWVGALRKAVLEGNVSKGSLMAGQSVGLVDKIQPLDEIINELVDEAEAELQRLRRILNPSESP